MKPNLFKRSMIFATFFGACLCVALLVAALGTKHWIDARAKRSSNPQESEGRISFGLFEGHKELNYAYGWRNYNISVSHPTTYPARRWAWLGCAALLATAALSSSIAALLAVIYTASAHSRKPSMPALYITNLFSIILVLVAVCIWLTEFYLRLQYNVMSKDDLSHKWTSEGMADFGVSFWLAVSSTAASFVNIIFLIISMIDNRGIDTITPVLEEKSNGAIMLY